MHPAEKKFSINANPSPFTWDQFLAQQPHAQFLQSWGWGELARAEKRRVWRIAIEREGQIIAAVQVIEHPLPLGKSYLYLPRGPMINPAAADQALEIHQLLLKAVRDLTIATEQRDELFLRVDPQGQWPTLPDLPQRPINAVQPQHTLLIDLAQPEHLLLANFHQKTRYNIGLAERHGVQVRQGETAELPAAGKLLRETAQRQGLRLHPQAHYQRLLELANDSLAIGEPDHAQLRVQLWIAEKDGQPLATAITASLGDTLTYLHGGSDHETRQLMAPHLLHWQIICWARQTAHRWYDLGGAAPPDGPNHPWAGLTRFKLGFGAAYRSHPESFDIVFEPGWYGLYRVGARLRKFLR